MTPFLRWLIPFTLLWAVIPLVVEGTPLAKYNGPWTREVPALLVSIVIYFGIWLGATRLLAAATDIEGLGLALGTIVALASLIPGLWIGYKLFGVRPSEHAEAH